LLLRIGKIFGRSLDAITLIFNTEIFSGSLKRFFVIPPLASDIIALAFAINLVGSELITQRYNNMFGRFGNGTGNGVFESVMSRELR